MARCLKTFLPIVLAAMFVACGNSEGGANFTLGVSNNSNKIGTISIGLTDAPVENAKQVVIEIDKIIFKKVGEDDVVVDRFNSTDLSIIDADTFQIDLLAYQRGSQAIVINQLELKAGTYSSIVISIIDGDNNRSFVLEDSGGSDIQTELSTASSGLQLQGLTVAADGEQTFTIKFDLQKSLLKVGGRYQLVTAGIRLQDNQDSTYISGDVDASLFNTDSPCTEKTEPTVGNIVYLYRGHGLDVTKLVDVYAPDIATSVPADAIAPYASSAVVDDGGSWKYDFSFLPAGDYTLAFSCQAENDDPQNYDALVVVFPEDQIKELPAIAGGGVICNLPITNGSCASR